MTLWIEDSLLRTWREIEVDKKVVGECLYSDSVIQCCLLLGKVYHQPLRQTTGFVKSMLIMMGHPAYAVPDYSTLCRRQACVEVEVGRALTGNKKIDLAIDSTGLKVGPEITSHVRSMGRENGR